MTDGASLALLAIAAVLAFVSTATGAALFLVFAVYQIGKELHN
jgi:hypothetical protein